MSFLKSKIENETSLYAQYYISVLSKYLENVMLKLAINLKNKIKTDFLKSLKFFKKLLHAKCMLEYVVIGVEMH